VRSSRAIDLGCLLVGSAARRADPTSCRAAPQHRLGLLQLEGGVQGAGGGARPRSSAMMQVIRMSDVEIISMLMPASASAPNIRAA
jgi:hypothetical protein